VPQWFARGNPGEGPAGIGWTTDARTFFKRAIFHYHDGLLRQTQGAVGRARKDWFTADFPDHPDLPLATLPAEAEVNMPRVDMKVIASRGFHHGCDRNNGEQGSE
jgi:hypothetical protein